MPKFTEEQAAVIRHRGSNALVRAVAGSGKTTALTARIAHLIRGGCDPADILVVQFGRASRADFTAKLAQRLDGDLPPVVTFHSLGRRLAGNLERIAAVPRRTIDVARCAGLARVALRDIWRAQNRTAPLPADVRDDFLQFLTLAKSQSGPVADVAARRFAPIAPLLTAAFDAYESRRAEAGLRDLDDLIYDPVPALLADPGLWPRAWPRPVRYLLVDEFQDVNALQYAMVRGLATDATEVMAVGDPAQAIFSFRGSGINFIERDFARDLAPVTELTLTRNFRYGHRTSLLANHIIHSEAPAAGILTLPAHGNPDTTLWLVAEQADQPSPVPGLIAARHADRTLSEAVLLVRNFEQAVPHEIALLMAGIPYHVYGRAPVLFVPEIAALVAALSVAVHTWAIPPEARRPFVAALLQAPTAFITSEWVDGAADAAAQADDVVEAFEAFAHANRATHPRNADALLARASQLRALQQTTIARTTPAKVLALYLDMTNAAAVIGRSAASSEHAAQQLAYIDAFCRLVGRYATVIEAIESLGELAALSEARPPPGDHLAINSIHAAKGREWRHVILGGWGAGAFPSERDTTDPDEERRLAYVAVTRAIDRLEILHPYDRLLTRMQSHPAEPESSARAALPTPDGGRRIVRQASSFLYDGEPGLCEAAGAALVAGQALPARARDATLINRYLEALPAPHRVAGPTQTRAALARTDEIPEAGSRIEVTDLGTFRVVRMVDRRVAELEDDAGAIRFVVLSVMRWRPVG